MSYVFGDDGTFSGNYNDGVRRVFVLENLNQCLVADEVTSAVRNFSPEYIAGFRVMFTVEEIFLRDFAATVVSESGHNRQESEGISRVIRNRAEHHQVSYSNDNFWLPRRQGGVGGDGIDGRKSNHYKNAKMQALENWSGNMLCDLESTVRGLVRPVDISNGAYFWEGTAFLNDPTNYFGKRLNWRPPVFLITARHGATTFMKYNPSHPKYGRNVWP